MRQNPSAHSDDRLGVRHLYDLDPYRQDAVEAGAQCLIAKDDIVKELPQAIRCAAQGEPVPGTGFPTAREANRKLNEGHATEGRLPENDKPSLSSRERDVLRLYAHGSSTDEIAALLNVSKGSVFTYVNRACRKLHAADRKEALAICARYDLL